MKIKKERMPFSAYKKKKKYDINDDIIVVEKSSTIYNICITIIKIICYTILLSLAFIGIISIIIPDTREILIFQVDSIFNEFFKLIQ